MDFISYVKYSLFGNISFVKCVFKVRYSEHHFYSNAFQIFTLMISIFQRFYLVSCLWLSH